MVPVNDRKYFIAPGEGLEGDLTDVDCDDIARACIVRNMHNSDVDEQCCLLQKPSTISLTREPLDLKERR